MLPMKAEDRSTYDPKNVPATPPATTPPLAPVEPSPVIVPDAGVDLDFTTPNEERSSGEWSDETGSDNFSERYYCPMKCEGEKTYDQPGNCPVCGMKLVRADTV